jgi:hypothetical protein
VCENRVLVDGNLITSRSHVTAIVEKLLDGARGTWVEAEHFV